MGFLMYCDNKKCGKSQEPMLDKKTDEVFCSACGEVIKNVTPFAKASMRSMSQFKRTVKSQEAFAVNCDKCAKMSRPKLDQNSLICPHCGTEHTTLTAPYIHAIKEYIKTNSVSGRK